MPQLDDRLIRLAQQRPPVGAGELIQRIENLVAGAPVRRVAPGLHPVRALVLAATSVLVFVGGVAVGHWAFGSVGWFDVAFGGSGGWITSADISVLGLVVAGASGGIVLLIGALILTRRRGDHRRIYRASADRGGIMETIERTTQKNYSADRVLRINRWLAVGLVLAIAGLAALGSWLLIDNFVKSDSEQIVLDSTAALNSGDRSAWIATYSDDAVLTWVTGGSPSQVRGTQELFAWAQEAGAMDLYIDIAGPTVVNGDHVTVPVTATWRGTVGEVRIDGIQVFRFSDGQIVENLLMGSSTP